MKHQRMTLKQRLTVWAMVVWLLLSSLACIDTNNGMVKTMTDTGDLIGVDDCQNID